MKTKWIITCVAAATLFTAITGTAVIAHAADTTAIVAEGQSPGPWRLLFSGQVGRLMTLRSELAITTDQRQQIRSVLQSHRYEIADVLQPLVAKRRALRDAVLADNPDEKAIRAAANDMATDIGDAAVFAAKLRGEIAPILTADQRAKIADFRKNSAQTVDHFLDTMRHDASHPA